MTGRAPSWRESSSSSLTTPISGSSSPFSSPTAETSAAALRHYKVVFEKNPSLAADAIFQMSSIFTRAGKTTELIELLNGVDAKALSFSSITYLINLIQLAPTDPRTSDLVHTLYRKAWAAFPDTRYMMVNRVARPDLWRMPEMFDFACESILAGAFPNTPLASYTSFVWPQPGALIGSAAAAPSPTATIRTCRRCCGCSTWRRNAI